MNTTPSDHPVHREASFREAGFDDLIKDVSRFGPAPDPSRELFVTVVNLAIVAVGIRILQPAPVVTVAVVCAVALLVAVRWVLGVRQWETR